MTADAFTGVWTFIVGLLFVVLAGTDYLDRWRVQRSARSLIDSQASFTFDEDGIDVDTAAGTGHVGWSSVTELTRNDRVLVVKRDRVPIVWIPKRVFASSEEADSLSSYIDQHIAATRA